MKTYVIQWFNIANWGMPIVVQAQTPMGAISKHVYRNRALEWQVIEVHAQLMSEVLCRDVTIYHGTMADITEQYEEDEE